MPTPVSPDELFSTYGHCPICDVPVRFSAQGKWLRDCFVCTVCGSIPRERSLMMVIDQWCPNWRNVVIHESSPERRGTSVRLARECAQYVPSQFFPGKRLGKPVDGVRNENLEQLTFGDASIDLHVSQDVFEHVLDPDAAFREIARTLRPGGMHIFTVPIVRKTEPSRPRARMENGKIRNLLPEEFHGNPVGDGRSLVTTDWGYDICRRIFDASGLFTHMIHRDDMDHGIRAEYIEVLVTVKPA